MLIISPNARISPLAEIEDSVRGSEIRIEDGVVIDAFVKIKPAGGSGGVFIGSNTVINSGCVIYTGNGVKIGANCLIAANCTLASADHAYQKRDRLIREQQFMPSRGGIVLEDDVWVGANAVLLDGTVLREGSVVGAGAVVRGECAPYSIYVGMPLRKINERT